MYADEDVDGALQSLRTRSPSCETGTCVWWTCSAAEGWNPSQTWRPALSCWATSACAPVQGQAQGGFLSLLDVVLPRPEGLPFAADAKVLAFIYARARNRYRDAGAGRDVGAKVRKLIDDHVISMGVNPKIPPVSLTDANFETEVSRRPNDRAKASRWNTPSAPTSASTSTRIRWRTASSANASGRAGQAGRAMG